MARVACWAPLPPQPGLLAEYYLDLIEELAKLIDLSVIVRGGIDEGGAPAALELVPAESYHPGDFDVDLYFFADDLIRHGYMFEHAMRRPGVLALHSGSFNRFFSDLCGGPESALYREEQLFEALGGETNSTSVPIVAGRLVAKSLVTISLNESVRDQLARRFTEADVRYLPLAVPDLARVPMAPPRGPADLLVAVPDAFRDPEAAEATIMAVVRLRKSLPQLRCVMTGTTSDVGGERVRFLIARHELSSVIDVRTDVALGEASALLRSCTAAIIGPAQDLGIALATQLAVGAGCIVLAHSDPELHSLPTELCRTADLKRGGATEIIEHFLIEVASDGDQLRETSRRALETVGTKRSFANTAASYANVISSALEGQHGDAERPTGKLRLAVGVNAIGSWAATTGLSEAGRRTVTALIDAGVNVAMEDYDYGAPRNDHRFPARLRQLPPGRPHDIEICFLNVNELAAVPDHYLRQTFRNRTLVASWFWELPTIPPEIRVQAERVDEIWVASQFVAETFRASVAKPVHVVPCVVEPEPDQRLAKTDFGIDDSRLTYLFSFDANSTIVRKNPLAVIDAYERAFSRYEREQDVQLVVKSINLARLPVAHASLTGRLGEVGGILIEDDLTVSEMGALTALCDVYVSLHRAEGFGLGMAEAMYSGTPAVGTAYSGNVDFMDASNSCLVPYHLRPITRDDLRFNPGSERVYVPGHLWADPDVDQAARMMRYLWEYPKARRRLGERAAATIRERYSKAVVGAQLRTHVERLAHGRAVGTRDTRD